MSTRRILGYLAVLVLIYSVPWLIGFEGALINIAVTIAINGILALSLGLLFGYAGQLSIMTAAFYGVGAYTAAYLALKLDVSFWLCLPIAALAAMALAGLLSLVLSRMDHIVFALGTYAVAEMIRLVMVNWWQVTGGPQGISFQRSPEPLLGIEFTTRGSFYYIAATALVLTYVGIARLMKTRFGWRFLSLRENPILAQSLGINVRLAKSLVFIIAAGISGMAGVLYLYYFRYITPDAFSNWEAILLVLIVMIGGMGTLAGPVVGAIFFLVLPEVLHLPPTIKPVLIGVVLILVVVLLPRGIVGTIEEWWRQRRLSVAQAVPASGEPVDAVPDKATASGDPARSSP